MSSTGLVLTAAAIKLRIVRYLSASRPDSELCRNLPPPDGEGQRAPCKRVAAAVSVSGADRFDMARAAHPSPRDVRIARTLPQGRAGRLLLPRTRHAGSLPRRRASGGPLDSWMARRKTQTFGVRIRCRTRRAPRGAPIADLSGIGPRFSPVRRASLRRPSLQPAPGRDSSGPGEPRSPPECRLRTDSARCIQVPNMTNVLRDRLQRTR